MKRRSNSIGVCVSRKHYMVDISNKLNEIKVLILNTNELEKRIFTYI